MSDKPTHTTGAVQCRVADKDVAEALSRVLGKQISDPETTHATLLARSTNMPIDIPTPEGRWVSTDNTDAALSEYLCAIGKSSCSSCGRVMDRGDVSWNNADTGEGTPYTWAQIVCQACGTEVAHWSSWYPGVDDFEEFVEHVLPDWKPTS